MLYRFQQHQPKAIVQPWDGWVAETASVIGQVELGQKVSIWFGAVVRGDNSRIRIGHFSNIQENAVLHTDAGIELMIGDYVTVGHQAMLHGCEIGDNSLIGINAVILNHAQIGRNCIVGANGLVPEGKIIPDNSLVVGSPAKVIRELDAATIAKIRLSAEHYAAHFRHFQNLQKVSLDD